MGARRSVTVLLVAAMMVGVAGCDRESDGASEPESVSAETPEKRNEPAGEVSPTGSESELASDEVRQVESEHQSRAGSASGSSDEESGAGAGGTEAASRKTVDREGPLGEIPIPDGWQVLAPSEVARNMKLGGGNYRRKVVAGMPGFAIDEKYPIPDLVLTPDNDEDYNHSFAVFYVESPTEGEDVDIPSEMQKGFVHLIEKSRHDPKVRREPVADHLDCREPGHIFVGPEAPELLVCQTGDGARILQGARAADDRLVLAEFFGVGMMWSRSEEARATLFGGGDSDRE